MNDESIFYEKLKRAFNSNLTKTSQGYLFDKVKGPLILSAICGLALIFSSYKAFAALNSLLNQKNTYSNNNVTSQSQTRQHEIFVDVSGAVANPQTYKISYGTRLFQLLELAGGLNAEADRAFIQRNYNLAVILTDQQKVHFPTIFEVRDGFFFENKRLVALESTSGQFQNTTVQSLEMPSDTNKISINRATQLELESLPGIGPVTAQRIIAGRPFSRLDDLTSKEILKESLYQQIAQQLEL